MTAMKRHLNLRNDPTDRNKILDTSGNVILICVSGWSQDAEEVVKTWQSSPNVRDLLLRIRSEVDGLKAALKKRKKDDINLALNKIDSILDDV